MKYLNQFIRPAEHLFTHGNLSFSRKGKTELKQTIQHNSVYISAEIIKSTDSFQEDWTKKRRGLILQVEI